ncbi:MAG TPA: GNAT family N-acetyltransferase [Terriglobales bacterium]|nr:GNAT family N-acetyltransferase [Terriglobales bacterium]
MPVLESHMPEAKMPGITIQRLRTPEEMKVCVDLQKAVWGFSDVDTVPHRMFVVAHRTGGQVIGAFDRERPIGFVLGFMANRDGEVYIHSHMAAVLPGYQNRGIGRQLKLAQRDDALAREVNLIEWTFDPLQIRNAHFNIMRLGATVREYLPNVYGQTSSPLHHGLPTDRLVAQWRIHERRVEKIISGNAPRARAEKQVLVPRNIFEMCEQDATQAKQTQSQIRQQFQQLFRDGFVVTAFEVDSGSGKYLLEQI